MPLPASTASALRAAGLRFDEDVPLARRTYWRAGGPADALVLPTTVGELAAVQRIAHATGTPVTVLGNASNLLVADRGVRGIVVTLDGALAEIVASGDVVDAGAGAKLVVLLARAKKNGWTGLGCFAGIPGTVGGAVRMNAGSTLGETEGVLIDADVVLADGTISHCSKTELAMGYRTTVLPDGAIVARARLQLTNGDPAADQARIQAFLDKRKATQPLDLPSCGSTFRNPPGDFAGRLVEACGLKGFAIGAAEVSQKHANFVVNHGDATAADIRAVIEHVQGTVRAATGIALEREVLFVGRWE
jgi:UDP-N-acetylmuramate dehydrogenase